MANEIAGQTASVANAMMLSPTTAAAIPESQLAVSSVDVGCRWLGLMLLWFHGIGSDKKATDSTPQNNPHSAGRTPSRFLGENDRSREVVCVK